VYKLEQETKLRPSEAALEMLIEKYKESIGDPGQEIHKIRAIFIEYINLLNSRGLDAITIIHEKIEMIGRKPSAEKKTLNYLVGCLRNVAEYGTTSTGNPNEVRLITAFQNTYSVTLSVQNKEKLLALMSRFGISNLLFTMLEKKESLEELIINGFEHILESNKE